MSVWEIGIRRSLGKLHVGDGLITEIGRSGFEPLPITFEHAEAASRLPAHHRDPFDRMLVAQAQLEGLTIISRDRAFDAYGVPVTRC